MTNRRSFLRNASLLTLGGLVASGSKGFAAAGTPAANAKKELGLQIYSLARELDADVPGGLKKVAQMGYTVIELAGYNKDGKMKGVTMAEFK